MLIEKPSSGMRVITLYSTYIRAAADEATTTSTKVSRRPGSRPKTGSSARSTPNAAAADMAEPAR